MEYSRTDQHERGECRQANARFLRRHEPDFITPLPFRIAASAVRPSHDRLHPGGIRSLPWNIGKEAVGVCLETGAFPMPPRSMALGHCRRAAAVRPYPCGQRGVGTHITRFPLRKRRSGGQRQTFTLDLLAEKTTIWPVLCMLLFVEHRKQRAFFGQFT